jgi:hypothetical protein
MDTNREIKGEERRRREERVAEKVIEGVAVIKVHHMHVWK